MVENQVKSDEFDEGSVTPFERNIIHKDP